MIIEANRPHVIGFGRVAVMLHQVTLVFAGEVPTLNSFSRLWGEDFRLSALSDARETDRRRTKGQTATTLFKVVLNLFPPYDASLFGSLAGQLEESILLPGSGPGEAIEIEIVLPSRSETLLVRPDRYQDLEQVRALCAKLAQSAGAI